MKLSCIQILAGYVLTASTVYAKTDPCYPWSHPQYKCGDPITCQSDWPSETGNYGLAATGQNNTRDLELALPPEELHAVGADLARSQPLNTTCTNSDIRQPLGPRSHDPESPTSKNQCCMITLECYRLLDTAPKDSKGALIHLEDFKKFFCCWYDFIIPTPLCTYPPGPDVEVGWNEPPSCATWEGISSIQALGLIRKEG